MTQSKKTAVIDRPKKEDDVMKVTEPHSKAKPKRDASSGQMFFNFGSSASPTNGKTLSDTAERLKKILLLYKGKANAIHISELTPILKVESRAVVRAAQELKSSGYPVCSTRDEGYWWSSDPIEFNEYLSKQEKENADRQRITAIQRNSPLGQALAVKNDD